MKPEYISNTYGLSKIKNDHGLLLKLDNVAVFEFKQALNKDAEHLEKSKIQALGEKYLSEKDISGKIRAKANEFVQHGGGKPDGVHNEVIRYLLKKPEFSELNHKGDPVNSYLHENEISPDKKHLIFVRDFLRVNKNGIKIEGVNLIDRLYPRKVGDKEPELHPFTQQFNKIIADLNGEQLKPYAKKIIDELFNPGNNRSLLAQRDGFFRKIKIIDHSKELNSEQKQRKMQLEFDTLVKEVATNKRQYVEIPDFIRVAHRDFIQLIPKDDQLLGENIRVANSQFGGAILEKVSINNNQISSGNELQGILATDGAFRQLEITGNQIRTESARKLVINGLLGDVVGRGITDANTSVIGNNGRDQVMLWPLRLGGGDNIFVEGFSKDSEYQYGTSDSNVVKDLRENLHKSVNAPKSALFLSNVNMEYFHKVLRELSTNGSINLSQDAASNNISLVEKAVGKLIAEGEAIILKGDPEKVGLDSNKDWSKPIKTEER
ncbi:MAG: hypothetical protein ACWA5R_00460 [bacterium]